jgi:phosphopantetheinyl transferase (holo-ACP synthase)
MDRGMRAAVHLAVAPVAALPPPQSERWRERLDPAELAYCRGLRRAAEHLAARALARHAVAAALGRPDVSWRDVTVRREPSGRPVVALSERLTRWRYERGLAVPGVSLSHAAGHAAALAWLGNP